MDPRVIRFLFSLLLFEGQGNILNLWLLFLLRFFFELLRGVRTQAFC